MTSAPSWWASALPQRRGEAAIRKHGEQVSVFDADNEVLTLMNPSAFAIWELCDGATLPGEMAEAVAELTDASLERARRDVALALTELAELGLVDLGDEGEPGPSRG